MNRGENDASTKPELRASAEQLEQCYADKRDFLEMLPSHATRASRSCRVCLVFSSLLLRFCLWPLEIHKKLRQLYKIKS